MFHETLTDVAVALLGLIVTGIAIVIALIFNIKAIKQNSRNQQYQMKKDFYEKYHEIQAVPIDDPSTYASKVQNLTKMIWDLYNDGIVPEEMLTYDLADVVEETLWIYRKGKFQGIELDTDLKNWCDSHGLKPKSPINARVKEIKLKLESVNDKEKKD